jgi:long-chain acyl-CoA synthetase
MADVSHWRQRNGEYPAPAELLLDDEELRQVRQRAVDQANTMASSAESTGRFTVLSAQPRRGPAI